MTEPETNPPEAGGGRKRKLVRNFILANPSLTIREIVKATLVGERTVSRVRQELLRAGAIEAAPTGRPPLTPEIPGGDDEEQIRRDIDAKIAAGGQKVLTREERRQRLSAYADHPKVPHASKIAALRELEATEPAEQATELGPGVPRNTEERVVRGALILECILDTDGYAAAEDTIRRACAAWNGPLLTWKTPLALFMPKGSSAPTAEIPAPAGLEPTDPV